MSLSSQGINHTNVIPVVHNSQTVVITRDMSVSTQGINHTNVIPVVHNSQTVVISRDMSVSTQGINHNGHSVMDIQYSLKLDVDTCQRQGAFNHVERFTITL